MCPKPAEVLSKVSGPFKKKNTLILKIDLKFDIVEESDYKIVKKKKYLIDSVNVN